MPHNTLTEKLPVCCRSWSVSWCGGLWLRVPAPAPPDWWCQVPSPKPAVRALRVVSRFQTIRQNSRFSLQPLRRLGWSCLLYGRFVAARESCFPIAWRFRVLKKKKSKTKSPCLVRSTAKQAHASLRLADSPWQLSTRVDVRSYNQLWKLKKKTVNVYDLIRVYVCIHVCNDLLLKYKPRQCFLFFWAVNLLPISATQLLPY